MHFCPNELLAIAVVLPFVGAASVKVVCFCRRCWQRLKNR